MEPQFSIRKTTLLRKGRVSIPESRYFITLCTENRERTLATKSSVEFLFNQLKSQEREKDFQLLCGAVMPDHLHLVFRLGERLSLGRTIAKLKSKTKALID